MGSEKKNALGIIGTPAARRAAAETAPAPRCKEDGLHGIIYQHHPLSTVLTQPKERKAAASEYGSSSGKYTTGLDESNPPTTKLKRSICPLNHLAFSFP